jgi:hypothetical protein
MQDDEFVRSLTPTVEVLMQRPGMTFEKAVRTAYLAEGGEVVQGGAPQPSISQNRDAQKIERLKVASTIRPANSSSNSLNLEDIDVPDSIEDTIRLAERLTAGRS